MRIFWDLETYPNYFLFAARTETGRVFAQEWKGEGARVLPEKEVYNCFSGEHELVGFNTRKFDLPLMANVFFLVRGVGGATCKQINAIANQLILGKESWYEIGKVAGEGFLGLWQTDLLALCPPFVSLKKMEARLGLNRVQTLPIEPNKPLTEAEMAITKDYCLNSDLPATEALFKALPSAYEARALLAKEWRTTKPYQLTDAQLAEFILRPQEQRPFSKPLPNTEIPAYTPPARLRAIYKALAPEDRGAFAEAVNALKAGQFLKSKTGKDTRLLHKARISERCEVAFGNGGLHSTEKRVYYAATEGWKIVDVDVASYYPSMIITDKVLGGNTAAYAEVKRKRLALKRAGNPMQAVYKIALNGTFGKMQSKYSRFYRFGALEHITKTGQAQLFALALMIERSGAEVLSVNTDGITYRVQESACGRTEEAIKRFETLADVEMEAVEYSKILHKDVNNYWAITKDGKIKGKGVGGDAGLRKSPKLEVANIAIRAFLKDGTPLEATIGQESDLRNLCVVATSSKLPIEADGRPVGKMVRYVPVAAGGSALKVPRGKTKTSLWLGGRAEVINILPEGAEKEELLARVDREAILKYAQELIKL